MDDSHPMNETMQEIMKICNQSNVSTTYKHFILNLILIIVACKILHLILRFFNQPRIVSEFFIGLLSANIEPLSLSAQVLRPFKQLEFIASTAYMFVLGLEMEPLFLLNSPGPEAITAYAGITATVVVTVATYVLFHFGGIHIATDHESRVLAVFAVLFAATSSPIVTRLTTELKLGKSEIGRRAIRASLANDMVCTLLMCFLFVFRGKDGTTTIKEVVIVVIFLVGEMAIVFYVVRPVLQWVNNRNPEGQCMNAVHMVATVVLTLILCYVSYWFGYDAKVNSFLVGLAMPREGRVSNILISKINYILATFILPLYFSLANLRLRADDVDKHDKPSKKSSSLHLFYIVVITTVGKLSGTFAVGKYFGLHWLEAVTLAVLMNVKGYLQVFFTFHTKRHGYMQENSTMMMLFTVITSIIFAPLIVSSIVRRVRSKGRSSLRLMGLQWYDPTTELRLMVGLHGPQNVPAAANMVEMLRGGTTAGLEVSTVDMIRLTEHAATSLVYKQGMETVMVTDDKVAQMREQIRAALDVYMVPTMTTGAGEGSRHGGGPKEAGLKLNQTLTVSSFDSMHTDICCEAQENMVVLIILPFHKAQRADGNMDAGDPGFRMVNQNVLQRASCSVGILVDRGIGRTSNMSLPNASLNVAVVFTGGADGREALAYAACISRHPGIRLMVIRFLPDKEAMAMAAGPGRRILTAVTDEDKKMKVDDDYFASFYEQHIANKGVGYMEKHVINGVEAVATLRQLEGSYQLFIVGKGREQDSMLTAGMSERAECPELGPIGDILASSDFSVTASVLVIQQYDTTKDSKLLGDEFMSL